MNNNDSCSHLEVPEKNQLFQFLPIKNHKAFFLIMPCFLSVFFNFVFWHFCFLLYLAQTLEKDYQDVADIAHSNVPYLFAVL